MPGLLRRAAVTLALAAMALRALLPMGWMPNPEGFAQSPLIICLMDLPQSVQMDMDMAKSTGMPMSMDMHGGKSGQGQNDDHQTCPFAAAPHVAAAVTIAYIPAPTILGRFHGETNITALLTRASVYKPQSPRAPPALA
jgi:hypothetical protein